MGVQLPDRGTYVVKLTPISHRNHLHLPDRLYDSQQPQHETQHRLQEHLLLPSEESAPI